MREVSLFRVIQSDWKERGIRNREEAIRYCEAYRYSSFPDYVGVERKDLSIFSHQQMYGMMYIAGSNQRKFNRQDLFKQVLPVNAY